jgi:type II secretory pathway pseudopilin PulG
VIAVLSSIDNSCRRKQAGSALLMVILMVATMLLLTSTAILRIDTQGRREREAELAWRGQQYQRAIGMYFRKFGKYPNKIDDLVKQTNGVRFLRQAYPDPMNKEDGSWRFIYVGPSGQLIGSLRRISLLQGLLSTPTLPGAASLSGPGAGMNAGGAGTAFGQTGQQLSAGNTLGPTGLQSGSQGFNAIGAQPQSLQGPVIGGNIIGVASKMKQPSLRVYEGGETYEMWEFIWNPQTQIAVPGQGTNPLAPTAPTAAPGVPSNNVLAPGPYAPGPSIQGGSSTQPPSDPQGGANPQPQNPPVQ